MKKRTDRPFNIDWKSNKARVLGIWVANEDATNDNFIEQESKIKNKLQFWKRAILSLIGKIKVLNIFILSRPWYRTEFQNIQKNSERVEHQGILDFIWGKKKHQISEASLKLSRENVGLNLIDIKNEITTQRIKWLFHLIKLDSENFTKVVANKVMGKFNGGYEGLDIFKADITKMNPKSTDHFYRHAINVLQKVKIRYNPGKNDYENLHLFYYSSITIGSNVLLNQTKLVSDLKIFRAKDLVFKASAGHKQKVFNKIQSIIKCLPPKSGLQSMETYDIQLDNG